VKWRPAGATRRQAERVRDKIAATLLDARHGLIVDRSEWTLRQLSVVYLDRMEVLRPRSASWRGYRMNALLERLGDVKLEALGRADLERYAAARLREGKTAGTVNSDLAVLRHAVSCAVRWAEETGLRENRLRDWRPVKGPARDPRYLEAADVERILVASAVLGGPCHVFLQLYLACGARPGELLELQREDFGTNTVRLPALKGGIARVVVVDSDLVAACVASHAAWSKQKVRIHWERTRENAKLDEVHFYDLRHTVASEMLRKGATVRDVQRLFGHRSARMTERYSHFAKNATAVPGLSWAN
jgi:integrase